MGRCLDNDLIYMMIGTLMEAIWNCLGPVQSAWGSISPKIITTRVETNTAIAAGITSCK